MEQGDRVDVASVPRKDAWSVFAARAAMSRCILRSGGSRQGDEIAVRGMWLGMNRDCHKGVKRDQNGSIAASSNLHFRCFCASLPFLRPLCRMLPRGPEEHKR